MDVFILDGKKSKYEPKSARLKVSPYLQPAFPPHDPFFGIDPKLLSESRSPRASQKGVLATAGRSATFKPRVYSPPRVDMTYVQRKALYEKREADFDKKATQKYTRLNPMSSYKKSMIGAYEECVIGRKVERVLAEEEEYRSISQAARKRLEQHALESERLHEQQMKQTGLASEKDFF